MAYAEDISITYTHTSTSSIKKYMQRYNKTKQSHTKSRQNNLHQTLQSNLDLKINNTALPMATHPKVLGLALDPKLTYSTHINNISVQAHQPLQLIKALTSTGWGKQKETLMDTYNAVMSPDLEYASSIRSSLAFSTSTKKLHVMLNAALRTATGCTQVTNIQHLHDETLILPIHEQLQLYASQLTQKASLTQTYNILQQSKAKTLSLTTATTQQTFPQTATQSLQQT